ncbi:MAG: SDR family oxidoreductase [Pseudomonadota bacterium]
MPKILVTGANGFVGTQLCYTLQARGLEFAGAVRKKTSPSQYQTGDLNAATDWSQALSACDTVIHLAARVHVMKDNAVDPLHAYRAVNVDATMNLARQAVAHGIRRFVFVSSVKVNGEGTTDRPFSGADVPAPADPYGQSKLEAETALLALSRQSGLELVIVRPPLVYGPGVRANFLRLMQLVKLRMPLPFRNIHNRRSMVALDNLVDFLILCVSHPQAADQVFMISDDDDLSLPRLVTLMGQAMGKDVMLLPVPMPLLNFCARVVGKPDIASRLLGSLQVDIAPARERLGWLPVTSTETAVQATVAHYLARAGAA